MLRAVPGSGAPLTAEFEVGYVAIDRTEARATLIDSAAVRFELGKPVRSFSHRKRQRHFPGLWWSSTTRGHVGYESWLERDHLMLLDFEPSVVGIASQPFWLFWDEEGRRRSHAPDYFARLGDGRAMVIDCRPADRIKPRDAAAFAATERACELVGWEYRLVSEPDPVLRTNVRWLAGYRHPRYRVPGVSEALREVFLDTAPLMAGAEEAGDPIAVLPVLFHLLWCGELTAGLSTVLHEATPVTSVGMQ
jgi:hypothetical protein